MTDRPKLMLASGSPRRVALLNQAGIEADVLLPAEIDEMPKKGERPRVLATRLARAKADAALVTVQRDSALKGSFILAADTVVAVGSRILPKAEQRTRRSNACGCSRGAATASTPASA